MTRTNRPPDPADRRIRRLRGWLFSTAMLSMAIANTNAHAAAPWPDGVRVASTVRKFDDAWQYAALYELRPPRRLRARHLELAAGALRSPGETRPFVSLGPVWRRSTASRALFLDLGFSMTLLGGSTVGGRELGGNLHFTSSVALGTRLGTRHEYALALRYQHTSNGGLNGTNPGLDAIALNFTVGLPGQ